MKVKICGLKYPDNIEKIIQLMPDYVGFIFYKHSKRYVDNCINADLVSKISNYTTPVAVTVNAKLDELKALHRNLGFRYFQLHGEETVEMIKEIKNQISSSLVLIKVFNVDESFNFSELSHYQPFVDFFLFDTKGKERGGNGEIFNWNILKNYTLNKPYWLSGGIGEDNINKLFSMFKYLPKPYLLDLNSKLESEPGVKNIKITAQLIQKIKAHSLP